MLSICFVSLLIFVLQIGSTFSEFFKGIDGLEDVLLIFFLVLPSLLVVAFPLALMTGLVLVFARWTRDKEWLALKSCGVGHFRVFKMILPVALATTFICLILNSYVVPQSLKLISQKMVESESKFILTKIKAGQIVKLADGYQLYVSEVIKENEWKDPLLVVENNDGEISIKAERGKLLNNREGILLSFEKGVVETEYSELNLFGKFENFSMKLRSSQGNKDMSGIFGFKNLTYQELESVEDNCTGHNCLRIAEERSRRVSMSVAGLFFCFLGLLLLGFGILAKVPLAIFIVTLIATCYYFADRLGSILSEKGVITAIWGAWLPSCIIMLVLAIGFAGRVIKRV